LRFDNVDIIAKERLLVKGFLKFFLHFFVFGVFARKNGKKSYNFRNVLEVTDAFA